MVIEVTAVSFAPIQGAFDGAALVLKSPLALAVTVAACLALAPVTAARSTCMGLLFCTSAAAVGWVARPLPVDAFASTVSLTLGAAAAAGLRLRGGLAWGAMVLGGTAAGLAGKMQTASWGEALGAALALFLVTSVLNLAGRLSGPQRLSRAAVLARRMAGAWIAALGALMLALWFRGHGG